MGCTAEQQISNKCADVTIFHHCCLSKMMCMMLRCCCYWAASILKLIYVTRSGHGISLEPNTW